jgi:hypothetical protein
MRPHNDYYDEFDDIDSFAFDRSWALQKLLDEHRREQRDSRESHRLDHFKGRRRHADWDWQDEDDWD